MLGATADIGLDYWLYTNGLALNSAPIDILSAMQLILVSIDGDKKAQEQYRGIGTYETIIQNISKIRSQISVPILARVTVEETTDLYKSITTLLKLVDHVYWQIEMLI